MNGGQTQALVRQEWYWRRESFSDFGSHGRLKTHGSPEVFLGTQEKELGGTKVIWHPQSERR